MILKHGRCDTTHYMCDREKDCAHLCQRSGSPALPPLPPPPPTCPSLLSLLLPVFSPPAFLLRAL